MITLKKHILTTKKQYAYSFYTKVNPQPKIYEKITREEIYNYLISSFIDDPEIILRLCTVEEINILKQLLETNIPNKNLGYIEYLLLENLLKNNLIFQNETEYYIPKDLINPIKMAINIYNEEEYSLKDVIESALLGLIRIHNVIEINTYLEYLNTYNIIFTIKDLKNYLISSTRLKDKLLIIPYQKKEYVISLEYPYYKDILNLKNPHFKAKHGSLEELISIGKYKINLFQKEIFNFLSFLEAHLEPQYINLIINDLIIYMGFNLNNIEILHSICDNIPPLEQEVTKSLPFFPVWIYNGLTTTEASNLTDN